MAGLPCADVEGHSLRLAGAGVALLAVLMPVGGLWWAGEQAHAAVVDRVLAGEQATASAVALQVHSALADAVSDARAAADRTSLRAGLAVADPAPLSDVLTNIARSGPLVAVAAYDRSGRLRSSVGPVPPSSVAPVAAEAVGKPTAVRQDTELDILEPVGPGPDGPVGTLRIVVSFRRLISDVDALRFGRTGISQVVARDGRYLLSPDLGTYGSSLSSPVGLRVAAQLRPARLTVYSPRQHTRISFAYAPVPGQDFGVFTRQYTSEAFAGAGRLRSQLRAGAAVALVLGLLLLALGGGLARRYRDRLRQRDRELHRRRGQSGRDRPARPRPQVRVRESRDRRPGGLHPRRATRARPAGPDSS